MGALEWTQIIVAFIAAGASLGGAAISGFVLWHIRPVSYKRLGDAVEDVIQAGHGNTMLLRESLKRTDELQRDIDRGPD